MSSLIQVETRKKPQVNSEVPTALSRTRIHHYDIEIVDACNLRCPSCPRGNSLDVERPKGYMKLDQFERIIGKILQDNPAVEGIGLYNWGEPMLHPDLPGIIRAVRRRGLLCSVSSNLNIEKNLEEIVKASPDIFRVSVSGFHQEVYSQTHLKGDIEVVKANMRKLAELRTRHRTQTAVEVLYHVYLHNVEEDLFRMQELAQELGFLFHAVYAFLMPLEKSLQYFKDDLPDTDKAVVDLMAVRPEDMRRIALKRREMPCTLNTKQMAINADGSVALCCGVYNRAHDVARSFETISFEELQQRRFSHSLCNECSAHGLHVSAHYTDIDEWHRMAEQRFRERNLDVKMSTSVAPYVQVDSIRRIGGQEPIAENEPQEQPMPDAERQPKLSVLIPTFNRAGMLAECLDSVQATTVDCEIIVMDNASEDDTEAMMRQRAADDPRIRYVRHSHNIGGTENFNEILKAARGETICILGDDDAVLPDNFERKLAIFDAHPEIGLVHSQALRIDGSSRVEGAIIWPGILTYSYIGSRHEFYDLLPASYMLLQTVVFRRSLFDTYGGFEELPGQLGGADWDMLLRFCYHTKTAFIAEPLACVRYHAGMISETLHRADGRFAKGRIAVWRRWLVEPENPPVVDERVWQIMRDAFVPDLHHEFGDDPQKVAFYLSEVEQLKRENNAKVSAYFAKLDGTTAATVIPDHISVASQPAKPPISWMGPLFDPSGYADEARQFLLALHAQGWQPCAQPVQWSSRIADLPPADEAKLIDMGRRPANAGGVHVSHIFPPHFTHRTDAAFNIGRTMFETDRLPEGWVEGCNRMDRVWVPSEFNKQTFERAGVDPSKIAVIPGTLDFERYDGTAAPLPIDGARGFNFLSVFDWTLRKGWDVLIKAYIESFKTADDVALILKVHSSSGLTIEDIAGQVAEYLVTNLHVSLDDIPDIVFQGGDLPELHMPNLYAAADCFVLPTRGEGWGRPYMEAMAMGLPVIGTNWSGNTAFMNPENSYLIECATVRVPEIACEETPTYRGHCWAEPNIDSLKRHMRDIYENQERAKAKGLVAQADVRERFAPAKVAQLISDEIEGLLASGNSLSSTPPTLSLREAA
jgi:glycosyltransferase involved in cell wall biosynthesis/MoaA/NifB/PqqE/SkfB family radical SAM enzyme